jgi:hypothetical protein
MHGATTLHMARKLRASLIAGKHCYFAKSNALAFLAKAFDFVSRQDHEPIFCRSLKASFSFVLSHFCAESTS